MIVLMLTMMAVKMLNIRLNGAMFDITNLIFFIIIAIMLINFIYKLAQRNEIKKYQDIIKQGDITSLESLIKKTPRIVKMEDMNDYTLLHFAVLENQEKIAELLVNNGANVNATACLASNRVGYKAGLGSTPLGMAVAKGYIKIAEFLISRGADTNAIGYKGKILHDAVILGQKEMVELLISKGADVNAKDALVPSKTPLYYAQQKGYQDMVGFLLSHGAKSQKQL